MEPASTSLVDAGDGYIFDRLHIEHSMLQSLLSGLRVSDGNFTQVGHVYESIIEMETKCRDQIEKLNSASSGDVVNKLVLINLCEDLLHAADREIAVVKAVMARTRILMDEAQTYLSQYENSRSSLSAVEEPNKDERFVDALKAMDGTASDLRSELTTAHATYDDLMNKWTQRVNVRTQLFDDIAIARKSVGDL